MWTLLDVLVHHSNNVREVIVPCSANVFNLNDMDKNSWVKTYWSAVLDILKTHQVRHLYCAFSGSSPL